MVVLVHQEQMAETALVVLMEPQDEQAPQVGVGTLEQLAEMDKMVVMAGQVLQVQQEMLVHLEEQVHQEDPA